MFYKIMLLMTFSCATHGHPIMPADQQECGGD